MERKDYDAIHQLAERFVKDWESKDTKDLADYINQDVKFYVSTCKDYADGGRHSLNGVSGFISEQEDTSFIRMDLYNFLANGDDRTGRFTAIICGTAASENEWKTCQFVWNIAVKLNKENERWNISEIRLDLCDLTGDFVEYFDKWYREENKAQWFAGVHLPMISGDLDGVDYPYAATSDILSNEEQIEAVFSRYAFGMDGLDFSYTEDVMSDDLLVNMAPYGSMDKRTALQSLKLSRCKAKYWTHPGMIESIDIHGDTADVRIWRMGGHTQRSNPLVLTKDNIDHRYACARYEIKMRKEVGKWKLLIEDYYLGIIQVD